MTISKNLSLRIVLRNVFLLMFLLIFSCTALAREAMTVRNIDLKQDASSNSATITKLEKNQPLNVGNRKGSWYEVKVQLAVGEKYGWVRMIDLRFDEALQNSPGESGFSLLGSVLSGQPEQTVGTGVRGIDNEDLLPDRSSIKMPGIPGMAVINEDTKLKNSKVNMSAVNEMEKFSISSDKARYFAEQGNLRKKSINLNASD